MFSVDFQEICDRYFLPLIQLLSSQTTFPSGGKARAAICCSMVTLLMLLGERLGREMACDLLGSTLQCFFASFSGVHEQIVTPTKEATKDDAAAQGSKEALTSSLKKSVTYPEAKIVEFHPLIASIDDEAKGSGRNVDGEVMKQLCNTFSKAMAHSAYIQFCKLLGQYYLHDCLCNADLIEQIAYSHDEVAQPTSPLASILTDPVGYDSDTNSEASSNDDSDDDDVGMVRDAVLKVGPIAAVTGLGMEESGFRKSSWFVDLEDEEEATAVPLKEVFHV